jgi:hypothetical protein
VATLRSEYSQHRTYKNHRENFAADLEQYARFGIFLTMVAANSDPHALAMIQAHAHLVQRDLSANLGRISKHLRERLAKYEQIYSSLKNAIDPNSSLHPNTVAMFASFEEALNAVATLPKVPNDPEVVHSALKKVSAAAHNLISLQEHQISELKRKLDEKAKNEAKLLSDKVKQEEQIKALRAKMKESIPTKLMEHRPVMVNAETAPIVTKLLALKNNGLRYPKKQSDGRRIRPIEWLRETIQGDDDNHLNSDEFLIALRNPTVFKPFDPRLYGAVIHSRARAEII